LGVSQSAVSREIHRNRGERGYRFKQAEAKAQARQAIRSKPRKLTVPTRSKIEAKLRQMRWSPELLAVPSVTSRSIQPSMGHHPQL
jgi:transposase, IS30 family